MLLKSGLIVTFLTFCSRILGLVRELIISHNFGTTYLADCVNVAMRLPNLFREILAGGALSSVFVPSFSNKLSSEKPVALLFASKTFSLLFLVLVIITLAMQVFMPNIMLMMAPGFNQDQVKFELAIDLCRIAMPYLTFMALASLLGGMLHAVKRFTAFAFMPIIANIVIISGTYALGVWYPRHYSLVFSLCFSGGLQLGIMWWLVQRAKLPLQFVKPKYDPEIVLLLKRMLPTSLASGAHQINIFISQALITFIPGAVSILAYAERLYQLPLALIGVSFATILLPELTQIYKNQDYIKANIVQNNALQIAIGVALPAAVGLAMLSKPLVYLLYYRGEFTLLDTELTAQATTIFAAGLPAFILVKILVPVFYANNDTKTPFRITLLTIGLNILLIMLLLKPYSYLAIALATSISSWASLLLYNKQLRRYGDFNISFATKIFSLKTIIITMVMGGYLYFVIQSAEYYLYHQHLLVKVITILLVITSAVIVYFISGWSIKLHKVWHELGRQM